MSDLMSEIWNNGYEIFCETDDGILWDYLKEQVNNGNITYDGTNNV